MKSKLCGHGFAPGDLVVILPEFGPDFDGVRGLVGVVMEREERTRARDYLNDPIYEDGCWVSFPTASDAYDRSRWHWLEESKIRVVSKA